MLTGGLQVPSQILPLKCLTNLKKSRDSSLGIAATSYGLDERGVGFRVPVGLRIFSTSSRPALGPIQPPIQWVPGGSFSGGKEAGV
jgi:hypothetical protein